MATARASVRGQRDARGLTSVLSSAVLEWILICLLFLDALFSYVVTKFTRFCELQTPCLFCSRLDHILGSEKPKFYRDLICDIHKMEISRSVYCCVHEKLSDAGSMCERCISSNTTSKKSDHGACKSSGAKFDPYIEYRVDNDHNIHLNPPVTVDGDSLEISFHGDNLLKDPLLKGPTIDSSVVGLCSCCNEPMTKAFPQKLLRTKSMKSTELDVPSSGTMRDGHLHYQDGTKNGSEKLPGSAMLSYRGDRGSDDLPHSHAGYTELKIISDSDSEVILDDDRQGLVCDNDDLKAELVAQYAKITPSDLAPEKLIHNARGQEPLLSVPLEIFHIGELPDATAAVSNGLEELKCNQEETKGSLIAVSKAISPDELSLSDNVKEALLEVTKEKLDAMGVGDTVCLSGTDNKEISKQGCGSIPHNLTIETNHCVNEVGLSVPDCMDLNDAYELAVSAKASQPPTTFTEVLSGKDTTSINDDLKLLLSQISAVRGFELSWNEMNSRVVGHGDDSKTSDISSAIGLQILPKRLSIERHESGFISLDESLLSEIEGESTVDRLKRQIDLDRKSLSALYKELEEERSASAIAANQAMAMINRLQEEKAAMQMEALQYQRMMEEQAEYDQGVLQKSNDLLADREKEIQDLEEEIEIYRRRYSSDLKVEKVSELISDSRGLEMRAANHENNTDYKVNRTGIPKDSLLDFENEKLYILKCLKKMENKLHLLSTNEVPVNTSELDTYRDSFQGDKCVETTLNGYSEEQGRLLFADNETRNGGSLQMESHAKGDMEELYSTTSIKNDLAACGEQISHLNERLKTFEEDRNFLEHTVNSLRSGNEGLHFVQEIASHLRKLRGIGLGTREQAAA